MTGQVNFDSHTGDLVQTCVDVVNLLTAGAARGKPYTPRVNSAQLMVALRPRSSGRTRAPSSADIAELADYATTLRDIFVAVDSGRVDHACATTNALLNRTNAAPVLARHGDEPWHLHFHTVDAAWAQSWAAPMATAIAIVLGNPSFDRLGICSAPGCDRVFADTSRNGTRRFCCTACQNRVKASAFRARQRSF